MDIKYKALVAIEGLMFDDIEMTCEDKLARIYKFAHVALGTCQNPHEDWVRELDETLEALERFGIISLKDME